MYSGPWLFTKGYQIGSCSFSSRVATVGLSDKVWFTFCVPDMKLVLWMGFLPQQKSSILLHVIPLNEGISDRLAAVLGLRSLQGLWAALAVAVMANPAEVQAFVLTQAHETLVAKFSWLQIPGYLRRSLQRPLEHVSVRITFSCFQTRDFQVIIAVLSSSLPLSDTVLPSREECYLEKSLVALLRVYSSL